MASTAQEASVLLEMEFTAEETKVLGEKALADQDPGKVRSRCRRLLFWMVVCYGLVAFSFWGWLRHGEPYLQYMMFNAALGAALGMYVASARQHLMFRIATFSVIEKFQKERNERVGLLAPKVEAPLQEG